MRSIRTKISVLIGGLVLCAMVISSVVTLNTMDSAVLANESEICELSLESVTKEIDKKIDKYITMTKLASSENSVIGFLSKVDSRDTYKQLEEFNDVYNLLESIYNMDSKNILSAFIASKNTDVAFDSADWLADIGYDATERSFWISKKEEIDKGYKVTEPYKDSDTGKMVVTISAPVYKNNTKDIIGIVGIDVLIGDLSQLVTNMKTNYTKDKTHTMLISNNGVVIAADNKDLVLSEIDKLSLSDKMLEVLNKESNGAIKFEYLNESFYGTNRNTDSTDWKLVLYIEESEYLDVVNSAKNKIFLLYGICAIVLFVAMFMTSKSIVAPLKELTSITDKLASGDLNTKVDIKVKDETGKLAESMNHLINRLKEYINYINEISLVLDEFAKGKLDIELRQSYEGDFEKIKISLLNVSDIFKRTIGNIINTSEAVADGSKEIANASQMLAHGASHQASTIEELTANINEICLKVADNAEHAHIVSEQVKKVGNDAEKNKVQMNEMVEAIEDIRSKSKEIGSIIKTIEDIAFQTNILALNAAVEAARAGEAGKGFAVVADEVRNLASKSADAAKNTTNLINKTVVSVERGNKLAIETNKTLDDVVSGVEETIGLVDNISQDSKEQSNSLEQTKSGIEQISNVVQTNAATAEESSAFSSHLAEQANNLRMIGEHFKLRN